MTNNKNHKNKINPMDDNTNLLKNNSIAKKLRLDSNDPDTLDVISNIKTRTSRWRKYVTLKRKSARTVDDSGFDRRKTGGIGLILDDGQRPGNPSINGTTTGTANGAGGGDNSGSGSAKGQGKGHSIGLKGRDQLDNSLTSTQRHVIIAHNRNLIEYFARLGMKNGNDQEEIDTNRINLEYVSTVLQNGANIDCTDKYGQTIFHEVARTWHVDIARFLIDHGANFDVPDNFGRTPLHIASAINYTEMVKFLIKSGAQKEARTKGELQTPVHFAARNDACESLKVLMKYGCLYKDVKDYKGRTPLQLAAELDRSETARQLLEMDDPAPAGVEDDSGQSAISWMITKMPPVAKLALDQFHITDRANRKQYFYLNKLDPLPVESESVNFPQSALQVIVMYKQIDLVTHNSITHLINTKWKKFGMWRAVLNTLINLSLILLWSVFGMLLNHDKRYMYTLPGHWWRVLLLFIAVMLTVYQIKEEITEYYQSRKHHKNWKEWRESEIERDIKYCHPRWPEEEQYLRMEIDNLDNVRPQYFNDFWNIFDWICYSLLFISLTTHLIDVVAHTSFTSRLHVRIMAVTIILLWLRLMKNARAFAKLGPFIVMLSHMAEDVIMFFVLYMEFYIPFAVAFWMIFGGQKVAESHVGKPDAQNHTVTVTGLAAPGQLMFSLFRLTLVDDYDFDGMKQVDSTMTYVLVGTWLALSAILMLNLFIALLSDTFQRVYDNAKANAVMQKAIAILNIEDRLSPEKLMNFRKHIDQNCSPEESFYDDDTMEDDGNELKKVTIQIKDQLNGIEDLLQGDHHDDDHHHHQAPHHNSSSSYNQGELSGTTKLNGGSRLITSEKFSRTIASLQGDISGFRDDQSDLNDRFVREMSSIKSLLKEVVSVQRQILNSPNKPNKDYSVPKKSKNGDQSRSSFISRDDLMDAHPNDQWRKSEERRREEMKLFKQEINKKHRKSLDISEGPTIVPLIEVSDTANC